MNIFKRIKNLWILSGVELPRAEGQNPIEKAIESVNDAFSSKKAQIVEMEDPIDEFMKKT